MSHKNLFKIVAIVMSVVFALSLIPQRTVEANSHIKVSVSMKSTIRQGSHTSIKGYISADSGYAVTRVVASVVRQGGGKGLYKDWACGSQTYITLQGSTLDYALNFASLEPGYYTLTVTAYHYSSACTSKSVGFSVER